MATTPGPATTALITCGGTSRRLGGRDKTREPLGASTVLDHLLAALPAGWPVLCVGEERATCRPVSWAREDPPGGGPVAALAAGLRQVSTPTCVVVAGDMPFAGAAATDLAAALARSPEDDAVVGTDRDGRVQPLLAAYRTEALRTALPDDPAGARLMAVLDRLRRTTLELPDPGTLDVDTPEALARARHIVGA
ncbi:molybdenum cofactor guanylyltransferase [Oryzihumus sp.]|uniref:molybdenum cofactor guanylyltransferase n=1 Tax=Oryzihumus sp. TaxID=1968903 RepID=UPI002EDB4509